MRNAFLTLGLLAALVAGGCATTKAVPAPAESEVDAMNAGIREVAHRQRRGGSLDYVIDPPDELAVYVKDNADLSVERVVVGPDGKIARPLIGGVLVAGRTVAEVTDDLRQRYAKYIREAEVTVMVVGYHSKWIYVDGEVKTPGRYPYTGSDSAVNAIAQAGFLTRRASPNGIHVARGNPNDPELYPVRLKDIVVDDDSRTNWTLAPEDIVYIPPSFMSRVGYAIEEVLFPFSFLLGPVYTYVGYDAVKNDN